MVDMLRKITDAVSVSGAEENASDAIRELIKGSADEIYNDALGNLIVVKRSGKAGAKKIMMAAHMDEIGFMVNFIEDGGFLRVAPVGGINWTAAAYSEVLFKGGLRGVLVPERKAAPHEFSAAKFYVDIGARDKADAETQVKIGDTCTVAPKVVELMNNRVAASKLDDKIACVILVQAMLEMKKKPAHDLYFVFTTQEELGLRGARTAAQAIMPDYAIAVDVTGTGDTPESFPMASKVGAGAAIKIMDSSVICHKDMVNLLMKTAQEKKIAHQSEILVGGGTDTAVMQSAGSGSIAGAISIASRYIHSGVEMCSMDDVRACVDLLKAALEKIMQGAIQA